MDIWLSVVIGSHNASAVIEACLAALAPQVSAQRMEVIVADSSTDDTAERIRAGFPWVHLLHFEQPLSVPALRGRGIEVARGEIIALLDPYSVAAPDWAERMLHAHDGNDHLAIGGSVGLYRPESRSWGAWALYFNEYGLFMPPVQQGETWIVPGSNVSYKRRALFDGARPRYPVFWKTFVSWEIERQGSPLWLAGDVRVDLNKPIAFSDFLRTRYDHGRCFAAQRVHESGRAARLWRAASAMAVPPLLVWRWTRGFWPKRRHRLDYLLTLPAQFLLFTVWSWGEVCGYARGTGGCCNRLYY